MTVNQTNVDSLAHAVAALAAHLVLLRCGRDSDALRIHEAGRAWQKTSMLTLATMPDTERILVATTQTLVELLAQSDQGRKALADFGFDLIPGTLWNFERVSPKA